MAGFGKHPLNCKVRGDRYGYKIYVTMRDSIPIPPVEIFLIMEANRRSTGVRIISEALLKR
ncbi:hypothetical protein BI308_10330 [Roseofilum reptotaenium AO1-A]|uniref:Uncharacterized protein n=1 Tax=Roseofilum reptotaenium AO1-A TaxID=1925591 RepID=A0A1L9QSR7_9CYAN|nr:hypothetical protein BI308_10330 [Roseofilum reptotaenium AO1-A]